MPQNGIAGPGWIKSRKPSRCFAGKLRNRHQVACGAAAVDPELSFCARPPQSPVSTCRIVRNLVTPHIGKERAQGAVSTKPTRTIVTLRSDNPAWVTRFPYARRYARPFRLRVQPAGRGYSEQQRFGQRHQGCAIRRPGLFEEDGCMRLETCVPLAMSRPWRTSSRQDLMPSPVPAHRPRQPATGSHRHDPCFA